MYVDACTVSWLAVVDGEGRNCFHGGIDRRTAAIDPARQLIEPLSAFAFSSRTAPTKTAWPLGKAVEQCCVNVGAITLRRS
jgi:hypothetical protein